MHDGYRCKKEAALIGSQGKRVGDAMLSSWHGGPTFTVHSFFLLKEPTTETVIAKESQKWSG